MNKNHEETGGKYIETFSFSVKGRPAPQGSKKHVGRGILIEVSKNVYSWRKYIKVTAKRLLPKPWHAKMGIHLEAEFLFKRPKSHYRANGELKPLAPAHCKTRVGDLDKLVRALADALTGVAYEDDSQIISLKATKRYARKNEHEGAIIRVATLSHQHKQGNLRLFPPD